MEMDAEQRRGRELNSENTKLSRQLQELRSQATTDRRLVVEYTETITILQTKVVNYKSQLEKTVSRRDLFSLFSLEPYNSRT